MNPDIYDFLASILKPTAIATGGAGAGWLFSRRFQNARAKDIELDNVAEAIKIWRDSAESLRRIKEMQEQEIDKNRQSISLLTAEVANLKGQISSLERENTSLRNELSRMKKG